MANIQARVGSDLDQKLILHCHAVLAGVKLANYFCLDLNSELLAAIQRWQSVLADFGLSLNVLCSCRKRYGLYVYDRELLDRRLADPEIRAFLADFGYHDFTTDQALGLLSSRLATAKQKAPGRQNFPHEIGVFLGYPLPDIKEFIKKGGADALLVGNWKVYHNVQAAKCCFDQYKESLRLFQEKQAMGYDLNRLMLGVRTELASPIRSAVQAPPA